MRFLSGLIGLVVLVMVLCFALSNRQSTVVNLWPLGAELHAPLYLLILGVLLSGLLLGLVTGWFGMLSHRFEARRLRNEIGDLKTKIMDLQQTVLSPGKEGEHFLPASKPKWRFWEKEI